MILLVSVQTNPDLFQELVRLEFQLFNKAGFCDSDDLNNDRLLGYVHYDANTVYHVYYCDEELYGFVRVITADNRGLDSFKTLNDFPDIKHQFGGYEPEAIAEIGTICVMKGGSKVVVELVKNLLDEANPEMVIASIDSKFFKVYVKRLGLPMQQIGEERFYMGSITLPIMMTSKDMRLWYIQ